MDVKMIVTDLDSTLLRRDKTISDYTASVFRQCHDAGQRIVFATARPIRAVKKGLRLNIENDACIYHNGAVIEINGKVFKQIGIDHDTVNQLLEAAKQLGGMKISVEINDTLYANFDVAALWQGIEFIRSDFDDLPKLPADKILFGTADKGDIENLESLLREGLYGEISENEVLMVMNKQSRKRNAIKDVADYFEIPLSDVAAFGDDYNDIEMLRDCGIGVAVANAIPEAKNAAKYVCGGCDEDGVARWLEENVL